MIRHSFRQPPEVWAGTPGGWRAVTHANRAVHPEWGETESVHWKSDEFTVQGWLMYPVNFDPAKRYPLVVSVHGGPASAKRSKEKSGAGCFSAAKVAVPLPLASVSKVCIRKHDPPHSHTL